MAHAEPHTVDLKPKQVEYLKQMAEKYSLYDESKALRVLIDFAMQEAAEETRIFEEIRCLHC